MGKAELARAEDPRQLVPGDPRVIWEMADSWGSLGLAFENIGLGFRAIDDGGWCGTAADAFRACLEQQPKRFLQASDAFVSAAVALDTYASALSWAQRQAGEAIALAKDGLLVTETQPSLTVGQQVERTGVVGGEPSPVVRRDAQGSVLAAVDTLARAREQVRRIGREAAGKVREASAMAVHPAVRMPVVAVARAVAPVRPVVIATVAHRLPVACAGQLLDHDTLRDSPWEWDAGVAELRGYLRLGMDRVSPRLRTHLFEGTVKKRKVGNGYRDVGYHHREGGVDRGGVRVVRVVAPPDDNGVYRARVAGGRTAGGAEFRTNTFFPDSWSRAEVLRAVRLAFLRRTFDLDDPGRRRRWRGRARGLVIEGYVESRFTEPSLTAATARLYHVVTAYPIYRSGCGQSD